MGTYFVIHEDIGLTLVTQMHALYVETYINVERVLRRVAEVSD